jgi:hypothetical protein
MVRSSSFMSVVSEPLPPPGSESTRSATFSAPEMAFAGAAGGVTAGRSAGTSPAKAPELRRANINEIVCQSHLMRGDLEACIRDVNVCRRFTWISDELRDQLGRCLFELTSARRMAP